MWHQMSIEQILSELKSSLLGLDKEEAARRLLENGPNELPEKAGRSPFLMLLNQFTDLFIIILLCSAFLSMLIGKVGDAIPILAIVILNAIIGFTQDFRAERAMAALRKMAGHTAMVVRQGSVSEIPVREIVTGDLVLLEPGAIAPADLRLYEAALLKIDESALTGESMPVEKRTDPIPEQDLVLGDRNNTAYHGTVVVYGRGAGIVVATGQETELGKIAGLIKEEKTKTPLQKRLAVFGRTLSIAIVVICAIVFVSGLLRGEALPLMFLTAISLAVAAIPEALPAVVTIALAFGASKMVRQNALIRKLSAVETLGSVTYICTDKTGTLTLNRMEVTEILVNLKRLERNGFLEAVVAPIEERIPETKLELLLTAFCLSNDTKPAEDGSLKGDPTETALAKCARELGYKREEMERRFPRIAEIPFDSGRKIMTTIHKWENGFVSFTKGALESLEASLSKEEREKVEEQASLGLRTICFAIRRWDKLPEIIDQNLMEKELEFLGAAGIEDPPRPEANKAVELCISAGITPVMITGDHLVTARAIAHGIGIIDDSGGRIITGRDLDHLDDQQFKEAAGEVRVYARVAPDQKLKIVKALQERGEYVAMTGDGVNDAPALKCADIGISMGITGTDVAKESSDMILLDDNFATIVTAVHEGRRIYSNILKFITYTITSNAGTLWLVVLAPFFGLPLPLLPIQILWLNLLCDSLPGLALTAEPGGEELMNRPPIRPDEGIFQGGRGWYIARHGLFLGIIALCLQWWCYKAHLNMQTTVFTFLVISRMAIVMNVRSESRSIFRLGLLSNLPLVGAVIITLLLQAAVVYLPVLQHIFNTKPMTGAELTICMASVGLIVVVGETEKLFRSRFK